MDRLQTLVFSLPMLWQWGIHVQQWGTVPWLKAQVMARASAGRAAGAVGRREALSAVMRSELPRDPSAAPKHRSRAAHQLWPSKHSHDGEAKRCGGP